MMSDFVIRVSDERGHVIERVESARSLEEARERLLRQGLLVVGVKISSSVRAGKSKVRLAPFVVFNQQLVTLIKAGLPILTALDLMAKQQKDPSFRRLLHDVRERVNAGEMLSEAFENQGVFSKIYTTTLLAGEKSGNLVEVLSRYVHFQRQALTFRKKLKASLIYPALLVSMVASVLTFLVGFVVPRFAELYGQLGAQLPGITQFMLALSLSFRRYFFLLLVGAAAALMGLWRWRRNGKAQLLLDRLYLATPLLGTIWLKYQVAMFARMMSTLISGGLPLVSALRTAGASMQSRTLSLAVTGAAQRVCEGLPLARSLEESEAFPELAVEMIEVGESTGALSQMLSSVAEFLEEDVETALAAALSLIEPAMLILMAVVVGFVLISLYLPIFKLGAGIMH